MKKHLHLNPEEKKHVAMMIDTGARLAEVAKIGFFFTDKTSATGF